MLVAAEVGFGGFLVGGAVAGEFELEGAELLVNDLPDDFIGGHDGGPRCSGEEGWLRVG